MYAEGPEAAWRMEFAMDRILSVSKKEVQRREAVAAEARSHKPKRGPKPKSHKKTL